MKKIIIFSGLTTIITFILSNYIFSKMMPYQDAPKELLEEQNVYIKTYTPLMNLLDIIFLISLIITLISFFIILKNRRKNKINIGKTLINDLDKP
jgi:amino acid transporter